MEILTEWVFPMIYLIGFIITTIFVYRICSDVRMERIENLEDKNTDVVMSFGIALLIGLLWPILLLGFGSFSLVYKSVNR